MGVEVVADLASDIVANDELVGQRFTNSMGLEYLVLRLLGLDKNSARVYTIRFVVSGWETTSVASAVRRGGIRDPSYSPIGASKTNTSGKKFAVTSEAGRTSTGIKLYNIKFESGYETISTLHNIKVGTIRDHLAREDIIGEVFTSNSGHVFTVLGIAPSANARVKYNVRFASGWETSASRANILRGEVRDRLSPSISGGGVLGTARAGTPSYKRWHSMLSRCYNPSNNSYKAYGAIGVTVCSRWLTLSNFIDDIPLLDGYDSDLYAAGGLELDKDIKQLAVPRGSRVYSPETCCLVTHEVNTSYIDYSTRTHTIYGTDPGGVKHTIAGVDRFAKSHGIPYSSITKVLRGEYDHYRGWHFYRTDPDAIPEEATA